MKSLAFSMFALVACSVSLAFGQDAGRLPAFPGAEGFGAASVGGRGGRVIQVTNLNPSGAGSLQAACEAKGPRIVVFRVSGVIRGNVIIRDSNITIAGQTAPGAGMTIEGILGTQFSNWDKPPGDPARHMYHDIIIRHLRARPPEPRGSNGDCIQISDCDRVILDHVSVSWGSDENIDLCASRNVTVQWCTIEESDVRRTQDAPPAKEPHNHGMILGYAGKNASIHHNLFAHHSYRSPLCGMEVMDHRNNVIYDLGVGVCWHPPRMNRQRPGENFRANVVGNYFKPGPSALKDPKQGKWIGPMILGRYSHLFAEGNYFSWAGGYLDIWKAPLPPGVFDRTNCVQAETGWPAEPVTTQWAEKAYELVLAQGGCFPRDAVTRRTIEEVREGTGSWGRHDPEGGLLAGLKAAAPPPDADADGMPDAWERAHGLNPQDPSDANKTVPAGASPADRNKGYTYIEYYINELADGLIPPPGATTAEASSGKNR